MLSMSVYQQQKFSNLEGTMNIYENGELEQKLDEMTDLIGELILDVVLASLRKLGDECQTYREFAEIKTRDPRRKRTGQPF